MSDSDSASQSEGEGVGVEHEMAGGEVESDVESFGSGGSSELEAMALQELKGEKKAATTDEEGLRTVLARLRPAKRQWVETLAVESPCVLPAGEGDEEGVVDSVHDDFKRETAIYEQALASSLLAQGRFDEMGVKYIRPEDYYAEMLKSDQHMLRIKDRMLTERKSIEEAEQRRKQRDAKKFGKQVQAEKIQEKSKRKADSMDALKKWRKDLSSKGSAGELGEEDGAGRGKRQKFDKSGNPKVGMNRQQKNLKYGNKRKDKKNTSESSASSKFDGSKKRFQKSKGGNARPGKSKRMAKKD